MNRIVLDKPYSIYNFEQQLMYIGYELTQEELTYFIDNMISIVVNNIENYSIEEILKGMEAIRPDVFSIIINNIDFVNMVYNIIDELVVELYTKNLITREITINNILSDTIIITKK